MKTNIPLRDSTVRVLVTPSGIVRVQASREVWLAAEVSCSQGAVLMVATGAVRQQAWVSCSMPGRGHFCPETTVNSSEGEGKFDMFCAHLLKL